FVSKRSIGDPLWTQREGTERSLAALFTVPLCFQPTAGSLPRLERLKCPAHQASAQFRLQVPYHLVLGSRIVFPFAAHVGNHLPAGTLLVGVARITAAEQPLIKSRRLLIQFPEDGRCFSQGHPPCDHGVHRLMSLLHALKGPPALVLPFPGALG